MRRLCFSLVFLFPATLPLWAQPDAGSGPVLAVVSSSHPFSIGRVEAKPEAGPIPVVEGDQVSSSSAPVMFRLNGENRLVLGGNSRALIRAIRADGHYFYLSSGSLEFDARKEPLAICARDHLYVPSIPGSGEIVIRDNKVDVRLTSGQMVRSGSDTCNSKAAPLFPANGIEAAAPAGTPAGGAGTATATAAAAGGTALPVTAAISIATASALGIATGEIASQSPASSSPTLPNP
jgi:hypothetical protein